MANKKTSKKCSICHKPYRGFGNNARPINSGRCCDRCNAGAVIPIRLGAHVARLAKQKS